MELQTSNTISFSRKQLNRKEKRPRFWKVLFVICLILVLTGGVFLYSTNQGLQIRRMLLGTVLSKYHPQYEKYMELLLPKSEIEAIYNERNHPHTVQTKIDRNKEKLHPAISLSDKIKVDTINTINYTAKIMIIPDPTTVHIASTKMVGKGQPLSDLIKDKKGIAGINAGGFLDPSGKGNGGEMIGIVISSGKVLSAPLGDRDTPSLIGGFLSDGQFITGQYSAKKLIKLGVTDAVSFGPQLIVNGENMVGPAVDGAWGWAPRTALGQTKDGSIVMIITDGRFYWDKTHRGASMSDMAEMFEKYEVVNAIGMDGGGSTTMIKDGQLLLKPATSTRVGMRYLPNAWVVIPH
ncbi:phosphodiester glycosidase family protein [Neobacillus terrae]|uniref:phosphodiester glycosidase family protein n=1 Tax=Neobacillus terrae TaxID=3034837 RepID=UPI00140D00CD|nr:phosphodiester glycosidase family protein [Neobacillus terrae]NHM29995.1 phosphodiester glycosidase family protein [Neobacillus terrae]